MIYLNKSPACEEGGHLTCLMLIGIEEDKIENNFMVPLFICHTSNISEKFRTHYKEIRNLFIEHGLSPVH